VLLALTKDDTGTNTTLGIVVCLISIVLCVLYLAWGRRYGRGTSIFLYIVPLYWMAGLISLGLAFGLHDGPPPTNWEQILIAIGAAIVPTVIGHTALNHAMIHLPSQVVSIANLGQFLVVVIAILLFPSLGEKPTWHLLPPAMLVLSGSYIVIRYATPQVQRTIEKATAEPAGT
jgi:drug/metabolite transporter (DMT)-like permease